MPTDQERKLNKLNELLKMLDENLSREEFVKAFENVVKFLQKVKKDLDEENKKAFAELISVFKELKGSLESNVNTELSGAISNLKDLADKTFKDQNDNLNFIRDKVKRIKEGKDGYTPVKGKDYFDGLPGTPGKDGSSDNSIGIRDKLETLKGKERLSKDAIDGLEEELKKIKDEKAGTGMAIFGGNRPLQIQQSGTVKEKAARYINFTGATVSRATDGVVTVAIGGGTAVDGEVPTDSGDHINFTIAHTPTAGTFKLYKGGARQQATVDYTLTVAALVLTIALATGETLICDYSY